MTISSEISESSHIWTPANGAITPGFTVRRGEQITVWSNTEGRVLAAGADYQVITAPAGLAVLPLLTGEQSLLIRRRTPAHQRLAPQASARLDVKALERELDDGAMRDAELRRDVDTQQVALQQQQSTQAEQAVAISQITLHLQSETEQRQQADALHGQQIGALQQADATQTAQREALAAALQAVDTAQTAQRAALAAALQDVDTLHTQQLSALQQAGVSQGALVAALQIDVADLQAQMPPVPPENPPVPNVLTAVLDKVKGFSAWLEGFRPATNAQWAAGGAALAAIAAVNDAAWSTFRQKAITVAALTGCIVSLDFASMGQLPFQAERQGFGNIVLKADAPGSAVLKQVAAPEPGKDPWFFQGVSGPVRFQNVKLDGNNVLTVNDGRYQSIVAGILVTSRPVIHLSECSGQIEFIDSEIVGFNAVNTGQWLSSLGILGNIAPNVQIIRTHITGTIGRSYYNHGIALYAGPTGGVKSRIEGCVFTNGNVSTNGNDYVFNDCEVTGWGFSAGFNTQATNLPGQFLSARNHFTGCRAHDSLPQMDIGPGGVSNYAPAGLENWAACTTVVSFQSWNNAGAGIDWGGKYGNLNGATCWDNGKSGHQSPGLALQYQDDENNASYLQINGFVAFNTPGNTTQYCGIWADPELPSAIVGVVLGVHSITNHPMGGDFRTGLLGGLRIPLKGTGIIGILGVHINGLRVGVNSGKGELIVSGSRTNGAGAVVTLATTDANGENSQTLGAIGATAAVYGENWPAPGQPVESTAYFPDGLAMDGPFYPRDNDPLGTAAKPWPVAHIKVIDRGIQYAPDGVHCGDLLYAGSATQVALAANYIYFMPLIWSASQAWGQVGIENMTAGLPAGTLGRLGVFEMTPTGRAGARIADFGTVDVSAVAIAWKTPIVYSGTAGRFMAAYLPSVAHNIRSVAQGAYANAYNSLLGTDTPGQWKTQLRAPYAFGELPAVAPAQSAAADHFPMIMFKV